MQKYLPQRPVKPSLPILPHYLRRKLALLRDAGLANLVLCLDEDRCCSHGEVPPHARLVYFRRRIDPIAVLAT